MIFLFHPRQMFDVLETFEGRINYFLYVNKCLKSFANICFFQLHTQHTKNRDSYRRADGKFLLFSSLTFFLQRNISTIIGRFMLGAR